MSYPQAKAIYPQLWGTYPHFLEKLFIKVEPLLVLGKATEEHKSLVY